MSISSTLSWPTSAMYSAPVPPGPSSNENRYGFLNPYAKIVGNPPRPAIPHEKPPILCKVRMERQPKQAALVIARKHRHDHARQVQERRRQQHPILHNENLPGLINNEKPVRPIPRIGH